MAGGPIVVARFAWCIGGLAIALSVAGCREVRKTVLGCRGTPECTNEGRCAARKEQVGDFAQCYAAKASDCERSRGCKESGKCALELRVGGTTVGLDRAVCRALTFAGCAESQQCEKEGACTPDATSCVVTTAGCMRSEACRKDGRCVARTERSREREGSYETRCVHDDDKTADRCERPCKDEGACVWNGAACVAATDAHCKASRVCSRNGRCQVDASRGVCVARSAVDCSASSECAAVRACSVAPHGDVCAAVGAGPCEAPCLHYGMCEFEDGECNAVDDDGCRGSVVCAVRGRCSFHARTHTCAPSGPSDCEASLECKAYGSCRFQPRGLVPVPTCVTPDGVLRRELVCIQSECEKEGRCLVPPGPEVRDCQTPEEAGLPPWRPVGGPPQRSFARAPSVSSADVPDGGRRRPFSARDALPKEPPPAGPLVVLVDGQPLPIKDAIAATAGEEAVSVVLGTHALTCAAAERGWQEVRNKEERDVHLTVSALTAEPDGEGGYVATPPGLLRVRRASWGGSSVHDESGHGLELRAAGSAVLAPGAAERGKSGRLRVAYDATFMKSTLAVHGSIEVRGCGALPPAGVPRVQSDVEVEIAGRRVTMRGAVVDDSDRGTLLRLSSGPQACRRSVMVDAAWDYEVQMHAGAMWVTGAKVDTYGSVDPNITLDVPSARAAGPIDVAVDDGGRMRGFPFRIHGVVHALDCRQADAGAGPR